MTTETDVQNAVRIATSQLGWRLFRNNVGVLPNPDTGRPVRFGLANDSKAMNKQYASGDICGILPCVIAPAMVGRTVGIFASIECKSSEWVFTGSERDLAQLRWLELIRSLGGYADIVNTAGGICAEHYINSHLQTAKNT